MFSRSTTGAFGFRHRNVHPMSETNSASGCAGDAEGAPTLVGELKRGVNPYNLTFGGIAAIALGLLSTLATYQGWVPDLGWGAMGQGLAVMASLFFLLTLFHTIAHALMGWVFEIGLKAHCDQNYPKAARWLALAERPGMDHYDPHGVALEALRDARVHLGR